MRKPPSIALFPLYPTTAGTALLAIGVTVAWWKGLDIERVLADAAIRRGELWRLVTAALPHANAFHLIFNVYWLWAFGTLIEEEFGHFKTLGIFVLLAVVSSGIEYTFLSGGVGLSGVGYGLFGMLWVLSRRDPRFYGAVDKNTVSLFAVWFVLCIIATLIGALRVANIAHGMGAVAGVLLGWAIAHRKAMTRLAAAAGLALLVVLSIVGPVVARPYVNLSRDASHDEGHLAYEALQAGRDAEAVRFLRDATRMDPHDAGHWYNLGIALQRTGDDTGALAAYQRAADVAPGNAQFTGAAEQMKAYVESRGPRGR